jgi:hypothetical protein
MSVVRSLSWIKAFGFAAMLFALVLSALVLQGLRHNAGVFVYPLDDAYIHLAVARTWVLHGQWGLSAGQFAGASSSPGWILLLAAVEKAVAVRLWIPLALNIVAALLLLLVASKVMAWALPRAGVAYLSGALCVLVCVVPLPGLAALGMEPVAHSLAALVLVAAAAAIATRRAESSTPAWVGFALLAGAAAAGSLRYESCFVVIAVVLLLLLRRRPLWALAVAVSAAAPALLYGIYSYKMCGLWLPFSVIMKSAGVSKHDPRQLLAVSSLLPLLWLLAAAFVLRLVRWVRSRPDQRGCFLGYIGSFLAVTSLTVVLHACIGPDGWLMRYEAYGYALGAVALGLAAGEEWDWLQGAGRKAAVAERWIGVALLLPALPGLTHRAWHGYTDVEVSLHDRYVEHLPQALFVSEAMPHAVVVANDIGFLAYYAADARILDALGLGSIEPVRLQLSGRPMTSAFVHTWAQHEGAQLAIIHTDYWGIQDMLVPSKWVLVESWCFPHNLVFQNHVQSFYAPDEAAAESLRERLGGFTALPVEMVRYRHPQDGASPPLPVHGVSAVCPVPHEVKTGSY